MSKTNYNKIDIDDMSLNDIFIEYFSESCYPLFDHEEDDDTDNSFFDEPLGNICSTDSLRYCLENKGYIVTHNSDLEEETKEYLTQQGYQVFERYESVLPTVRDGDLLNEFVDRGLEDLLESNNFQNLEKDKLYRHLCDIVGCGYHTTKEVLMKEIFGKL